MKRLFRPVSDPVEQKRKHNGAKQASRRHAGSGWFRLGKLEIYRDLSLYLDWLTIQEVRFIFPLLNGIHRRSSQQGLPRQLFDPCDVSSLGNIGLQFNHTFQAHLHRLSGVDGLDSLDDETLRDALRNSDRLLRGSLGVDGVGVHQSSHRGGVRAGRDAGCRGWLLWLLRYSFRVVPRAFTVFYQQRLGRRWGRGCGSFERCHRTVDSSRFCRRRCRPGTCSF